MTGELLAELATVAGLGAAQVYLRRLDGKHEAQSDDGRWLYPASMIKVPLALAVGCAIAGGRLTWQTSVRVDAANETANDAASPIVAGYVSTVEELTTLMLQRSDNVATNVLYDVLGRERATGDVHELGFTDVFFRRKLSGSLPLIDDPAASGRNSFPAASAADVFAAIGHRRVPEADALLRMLATSWWDVKLSRGLEPGDRFAHKTGDTDEVAHDGGILTIGGIGWVLVVSTDLPSSDEHDLRFGAFMRALRPHLLDPSVAEGALAEPAKGALNRI